MYNYVKYTFNVKKIITSPPIYAELQFCTSINLDKSIKIVQKILFRKKTRRFLIENILCLVNVVRDGDGNKSLHPEEPLLSELNERIDADIRKAKNTDGSGWLSSSTGHAEGYKIYHKRRCHNLFKYVILPI